MVYHINRKCGIAFAVTQETLFGAVFALKPPERG